MLNKDDRCGGSKWTLRLIQFQLNLPPEVLITLSRSPEKSIEIGWRVTADESQKSGVHLSKQTRLVGTTRYSMNPSFTWMCCSKPPHELLQLYVDLYILTFTIKTGNKQPQRLTCQQRLVTQYSSLFDAVKYISKQRSHLSEDHFLGASRAAFVHSFFCTLLLPPFERSCTHWIKATISNCFCFSQNDRFVLLRHEYSTAAFNTDSYNRLFCFQADELEKILCHKFMRFMMMRAENFRVLRRKPTEVTYKWHL